ncbi:MAG: response regulator [bacterium]
MRYKDNFYGQVADKKDITQYMCREKGQGMKSRVSNNQRILVIDDDPVICQVLNHSLKKRGYRAFSVHNGEQAVNACQEEYYNIALIDLFLPDIPGIEVMRMIKEISSDTESIIITSHASLDTAIQAMQDGAFSYLIKPIDMKYMHAVISKSLEKQKSQIERRKAEAEKRKLEEQLFYAEKMKAIGTLAGGSAHDYNNILMVIREAVSLMSLDIDSQHPHYKYLKTIEREIKKGSEITKQLLGFARGDTYKPKPINITTLVKESFHIFNHMKNHIRIHEHYQDDIWLVEADKGQIEQVLLNLYINADQAMPNGGDLYLETKNKRLGHDHVNVFNGAPGEYVMISVRDTGIGMDEATKQRIFEPFFTTKKKEIGTGLGLASSYGIIKNHNGFINVYSELSVGTCFTIYLPKINNKSILHEDSSQSQDKEYEVLKGSGTVMLVDDDVSLRKFGKKILERLGYTSMVADSGRGALEVLRAHKDAIDLVILDVIMPDMSCEEVYHHLKEINPDIKVLLSSGYNENSQTSDIVNLGCNGFIQKPFAIVEFSRIIREILERE